MNDRADSRPTGQVPKKFCASPWVEGLLRMNGHFATCCKNPTSFGDWTTDGLEKVWRSDSFQDFRRDVTDGKFPDRFCASCFKNGSAQSLRQLTQKPFIEYLHELSHAVGQSVYDANNEGIATFGRLRELWSTPQNRRPPNILPDYFREIERYEALMQRGLVVDAARPAIETLRATGKLVRRTIAQRRAARRQASRRSGPMRLFMTWVRKIRPAPSLPELARDPLAKSVAQLRRAQWRHAKVASLPKINRLRELWEKAEFDTEAEEILNGYFQQLDALQQMISGGLLPDSVRLPVNKLRVLGKIVRDFLRGETQPEAVAPLRQSNLIAICNARCIHCPGLFSKEIELGAKIKNGERFREMATDQVDKSFARQNDIIDFFMNGSELLFAKNWPTVAERLKQEGVRVRVSTNGMLLTEKNARLLIDNNYLGKLNLSLDGATPATIERVRARVKYDRVMSNLKFMMPYAAEKNADFRLSLSFALLDSNYHELPDFVVLAESVRKLNPKICPTIMVQQLSLKGVPSYGEFVAKHHPSLIDREALVDSFKRMHQVAQQHNIPVYVFHTYTLSDFIAEGCPVPSMEFQSNTAPQLEDEFVEAAAG